MENQKQCFKCGEIKPVEEFYRHPKMADGRLNRCKSCTKVDVRKNELTKHEHYKAYKRHHSRQPEQVATRKAYSKTPAGKAAFKKARKKYVQNNLHRRRAHEAVNNALRDGKLQRPSNCETCGATGPLHGHHDNYSKQLEVRWLCIPCHQEWHGDNKPIDF